MPLAWLSPTLIDVILAGVFVEGLLLRHLLAAGPARHWRGALGFHLGSGALLLLAVRFALAGSDRRLLALALAAAFALHLASLAALRRLLPTSPPGPGTNDRG